MELNDNALELIRLAITQELDETQKNSFRQLLTTDEAFRREYALQRQIAKAAGEIKRSEHRQQVAEWHASMLAEETGEERVVYLPFKYVAAASVALVLGGLLWWTTRSPETPSQAVARIEKPIGTPVKKPITRFENRTDTPSGHRSKPIQEPVYGAGRPTAQLFEQFYQPYLKPAANSDSFEQVASTYRQQDWQAANRELAQLDTIHWQPTRKAEYYFYQGLIGLGSGDYQLAMTALEYAVQSPGPMQQAAQWYLGLTYLKKGYQDEAVTQFGELARGPKSVYQAKAGQLLQQLKP